MLKAYGYYRVSTDEQAQEGKSIQTQRSICKKWGLENDFEIVHEFIEDGKSATTLNRPALKDLLSRLGDEDISAVIVQDTDRLARNTLDHLTVKALLKKHNVRLISISQPMIDDSPEGHLIDTIIASVNAFQSQITGRKTSKVLTEKAKLGWFPGNPPLGYINDENPDPKSNLDKKIIVLDRTIAPIIKKSFEMYASGEYSLDDIATFLNSKNIRPQRGSTVHRNTVNMLLKNEFFIGNFKWGDINYVGVHEPLVSTNIFNQVQLIMQGHNQNASRKRKHSFLLRGFLYSYIDHDRYIGELHKKENGRIYSFYCSPKNRKGTYVNAKEIEKQVETLFEDMQISKDYIRYVMDTAKKLVKEHQKEQENEKRLVTLELSKIERGMKELEDSRFIEGKTDNQTFIRIYTRYEEQQRELMRKLNSVNKDYAEQIKTLEKILNLAENVGKAYRDAPYELKRHYLGLFINKIFIKKGKIVDFELTDEVKVLVEEGSVRLSTHWGDRRGLNP